MISRPADTVTKTTASNRPNTMSRGARPIALQLHRQKIAELLTSVIVQMEHLQGQVPCGNVPVRLVCVWRCAWAKEGWARGAHPATPEDTLFDDEAGCDVFILLTLSGCG